MTTENPRKWWIFGLIIGAIIILISIFAFWRWGGEGLVKVIQGLLIIGFIVALLGLVIFAIIWLFKRHKKQMVFIMRNSIINTCKINKNDYKQHLNLYGSGVPMPNPKRLGEVIGFAMIKSGVKKMFDKEANSLIELENPKDIIFIGFYSGKFIDKILGNYNIFAGVYPDDFTFRGKVGDLTATDIYINDGGYGLSPQVFQMYWLQKWWKESHIIDETSKETIHRFLVEDNLNELAEVIRKAVEVQPKETDEESLAEQIGLDKAIPVKPQ